MLEHYKVLFFNLLLALLSLFEKGELQSFVVHTVAPIAGSQVHSLQSSFLYLTPRGQILLAEKTENEIFNYYSK